MKSLKKFLIGLGILGILSPLGLLASGTAWGEWEKDTFLKLLGFVPKGLQKFSNIWGAPFSDYTVPGTVNYLGYIISAFVGMFLVISITWLVGKILTKKNKNK